MSKKLIKTMAILISLSCAPAIVHSAETNAVNQKAGSYAFTNDNMKQIKNSGLANDLFKIITFSQPADSFRAGSSAMSYTKQYEAANQKFSQGNITAAYKDYKSVLNTNKSDDFVYLGFAYKLANLGLFSLAQESINNICNTGLYKTQIELIKKVFFPTMALSYDEEIYLAQCYTEIYFNNLAFEVVRELSKNSALLKKSDYANYILAQAYLNLKEYGKAMSSINKALSMSDNNANYLKLKAQIYCENNKYNDAIKTVDSILAQNVNVMNYNQDIEALKYFILARATRDKAKSKYYLANYFLKSSDTQRAIKELNQNVFSNKKDYQSYTTLGDIYLAQRDSVKAMDMYQKAFKIKKNDTNALIGIGNVYMAQNNHKTALDYFLKAAKKDKNNEKALINAALCYKATGVPAKSSEFSQKALKINPESDYVYYTMAQIDEVYATNYLKKALTINPMNTEAWLDLSYNAIKNRQSGYAREYLQPVKYLDKNNYRYYYISGLIKKQEGDLTGADNDFTKSHNLNPSFTEALKELSSGL